MTYGRSSPLSPPLPGPGPPPPARVGRHAGLLQVSEVLSIFLHSSLPFQGVFCVC